MPSVDERPVLIVSTSVDTATDVVVGLLEGRGVPCVRLNTEDFPEHLQLTAQISSGQQSLLVGEQLIVPRSVWYRRLRAPVRSEGIEPGVHDYCVKESLPLLRYFGGGNSCRRVMSPAANIFSAENKAYQLAMAADLGFVVPETCISNNPADVRAFVHRHPRVVCKPVRSGWMETNGEQWAIFTSEVRAEHVGFLDEVQMCPAIFQPLIPKQSDLRITAVGGRMFGAEILSQLDHSAMIDWRQTSDPNLPHRRFDVPLELASKICELLARLGLSFGALDFVLTPSGEIVFLEINPGGQWLWIDDMLDLGISSAVADWLARDDTP